MRNKIILSVFITAIMLTACSCGVMRSLGLYNVPPSYCDDFQKYFKRSCPNHNNSKSNLSIHTRPCKSTFSPYEEIEVEVRVINHSKVNTIYCYKPDYISGPWANGDLDVRDSLNHKLYLFDVGVCIDFINPIESYGRRLYPSVLTSGVVINPQDTLIEKLKFNPGVTFPNLIKNQNDFFFRVYGKRENAPGRYKVHYEQNHEEFDKEIGLIPVGKIVSDTIEYYVRDYTAQEINLRNDVADIIDGIMDGTCDKNKADSLTTLLSSRYPDNFYLETVKGFVDGYEHFVSPETTKAEQ